MKSMSTLKRTRGEELYCMSIKGLGGKKRSSKR